MPIMNETLDEYMPDRVPSDFSKIKVGIRTLEDATIRLGDLKRINPRLADKDFVLKAIQSSDYAAMKEISNFFFRTSGIYSGLCRYLATLYRYDWRIVPYINSDSKEAKVLESFHKALLYLDEFEVKRVFNDIALKVVRDGCYYGYKIEQDDKIVLQELPQNYCRSRMYTRGNRPVVEFNMKFFDDAFKDSVQRMKVLNLFPADFKKGYIAYKENRLVPDFQGDSAGWYMLDVDHAVKFNISGEDFPFFISTIPMLIDLDEAQALDRKKMMQKLLKVIIQKMPLDKNGDLIFDVDEAQVLHNNAVAMLGKAIGVDILTTFADVEVADMADKNTTTTVDELMKVERAVFNEAAVPEKLFNTDGNIALEKSILKDEARVFNLVLQFESFLNDLIKPFNKTPKKFTFRVEILPTTQNNYQALSKLYKEQMQIGFSKMLPQIALGHSQSSILANAHFENDLLDLVNVFIPPLQSSTMSADMLKNQGEEKKVGRTEKEDSEKSDKTLANRESMS